MVIYESTFFKAVSTSVLVVNKDAQIKLSKFVKFRNEKLLRQIKRFSLFLLLVDVHKLYCLKEMDTKVN